jgi:hypothetical protein
MSTGIRELDGLLGGGFDQGTVVLLRGGPGSGKTTLALQLIDRHLTRAIQSTQGADDEPGAAIFLSLEVDAFRAVQHVRRSFDFFNSLDELDLSDGKSVLVGRPHLVLWGRDELDKALARLVPKEGDFNLPQILGDALMSAIKQPEDSIPLKRSLIIVDSLNALVRMLLGYNRQKTLPRESNTLKLIQDLVDGQSNTLELIRDLVDGLGVMVRTKLEESVVLFTQEFHGDTNLEESIVAESFACDTEILLLHEPIAGESYRDSRSLSTVGYGIERRIGNRADRSQSVETRSFCRVLKSRSQASQSRRCAYDIVSGEGVVFYENYPGDGSILLFSENERQKRAWDNFFTWDIPQNYPALRFEEFDRSGLQRTFASQRGFRHRPSRVDLYLASFDTYWVNWYVELCQKWELASIWQAQLRLFDRSYNQEALSTLVGKVHRRLLECIHACELCPSLDQIQKLISEQLNSLECNGEPLNEVVKASWDYLTSRQGQGGLFHMIDMRQLRLFGELRSPLIHELEPEEYGGCADSKPYSGQPVHRPLGEFAKQELVRSVPYNANVSFLVCRADLLEDLLQKSNREELSLRIAEVYNEQTEVLQTKVPELDKTVVDKLISDLFRTRRPKTWEELIALCKMEPGFHFLLETQTFDTFLCSMFEFLWSCGGNLAVHADYGIAEVEKTEERLFHAFWFLNFLFRENIVPRNSTLEPVQMASHFPETATKEQAGSPDWLFARHWHSTFIDILTKRKRTTSGEPSQFVWEATGIALDICEIPISLAQYLRDPNSPHASCWGEWHFGILAGSENEALGLDLINNLMSSQKICERAFSCANLPTVEEFYNLYGDNHCFNLPERWSLQLPTITFQQMRERFFKHARFRSQTFDYRHSMRGLYAILQLIQTSPDSLADLDRFKNKISSALGLERGIQSLLRKDVLTA